MRDESVALVVEIGEIAALEGLAAVDSAAVDLNVAESVLVVAKGHVEPSTDK